MYGLHVRLNAWGASFKASASRFRVQAMGFRFTWKFPKIRGTILGGSQTKKNILGPILGSPYFGTLPYRRCTNTLQLPFRRVYPIVREVVLAKPSIFGFLVVPKVSKPLPP